MIETRYAMLVGCGERGAAWTASKGPENVIGLDLKKPKGQHGELILGDVFHLPIKNNAIDLIHADFIVNGLVDREVAAPQIYENPDILDTNYFPELVRRWFIESMNRSHDSVRRNIKEVSTLLKTVAMREMWRILANNGKLEILDFEYNTNWIGHYGPQIINEDPKFMKIKPLHIFDGDLSRSASLEKVIKGSTYVQKLELTKVYPMVGANLHLEGFGLR